MSAKSVGAVVLDRDGTIIEDRHYIHKEEDVVFYRGAFEALKTFKAKGYALFLVSNQSGVGRGWISDAAFQKVHKKFVGVLAENGTGIDEIAYCFHAPEENCPCRKPRAGLLPDTYQGLPIDWSRSYVVGDHVPDMGLAVTLGANPCLVLTGKGGATRQAELPEGTQVFENISEVAERLPAFIAS